MFRFALPALLCLLAAQLSAQDCYDYYKRNCGRSINGRFPYTVNNSSVSSAFAPGESKCFYGELIQGKDYCITICSDSLYNGVVALPEGARSFTGHMGIFRKGAFALANELQLPVVPLTINGSFDVLPRTRGFINLIDWHPLRLTIHQPIYPVGQGPDNVDATMRQAYESVMSGLVSKYQGYVENPDQ